MAGQADHARRDGRVLVANPGYELCVVYLAVRVCVRRLESMPLALGTLCNGITVRHAILVPGRSGCRSCRESLCGNSWRSLIGNSRRAYGPQQELGVGRLCIGNGILPSVALWQLLSTARWQLLACARGRSMTTLGSRLLATPEVSQPGQLLRYREYCS